MGRYYDNYWPPYVSVAERKQTAKRLVSKMKKKGKNISPIEIAGRKITTTFWGDAWCHNLEAYSDFSNRLPRGRSYVRNGSVIDLQIKNGLIEALVNGTDLYTVKIEIKPLPKTKWTKIKQRCAGQIGSLVELLQGEISSSVMEIVTEKGNGLFPSPKEIELGCSCPDWATMCKHVAAALYGVGARLDASPELLFTLRGIDPAELLSAAIDQPNATSPAQNVRVLDSDDLSVFGIDIDMNNFSGEEPVSAASTTAPKCPHKASKKKKTLIKKKTAKKSVTKKSTTKKSTTKKTAGRKTSTTKKTTKKSAAKKAPEKKKTAKKSTAKKNASKKKKTQKTNVKKTPPKKKVAKKTAAKKKKNPR